MLHCTIRNPSVASAVFASASLLCQFSLSLAAFPQTIMVTGNNRLAYTMEL
jgi:hypothetical protein